MLLDYAPSVVYLAYNSPWTLQSLIKAQTIELLLYRGIERNIDIHLVNLPSPFLKADIGNIGIEDEQKLMYLSGTVTRCGTVKSLAHKKDFKCAQCGHVFRLEALIELYNGFELPNKCPSKKCRNRMFEGVENSEE